MRAFGRKLNGEKGFTLVEMLIVVSIIAILIAVSIPLVNGALDKARHMADSANERAAKGAVYIAEVSSEITSLDTVVYLYDAENGVLIPTTMSFDLGDYPPYGQCAKDGHIGKYIWVQFNRSDWTFDLYWSDKRVGGTLNASLWNSNLCGGH